MKLLCCHDRCYFCGIQLREKKKDSKKYRSLIEIHHIKEKNGGGTDYDTNLVPLCSNHHSMVHEDLIKIDAWYNVGYCYKLKWTDEDGTDHFGPGY
jgi:predicted restriction endonuclease